MTKFFMIFAGIFGASALIMDAYGAHGLDLSQLDEDTANYLTALFDTSVRYQLWHALLLGVIALISMHSRSALISMSGVLCILGILLFCGTFYVRVLLPTSNVGLAPVGGGALILSWLCLAFSPLSIKSTKDADVAV